ADAGLQTFALLTGLSFLGNGAAIVLTPLAHQRMTPSSWVVVCLLLGALSQAVLVTSPAYGVVAAAAMILGLSVQGAKIAVDTIVQRDSDDSYRGRAFTLYDMLYNAGFVAAAALAAVVLPDTGWSRAVFAGLAMVYLVIAAIYRRGIRSVDDRPRPVLAGERPSGTHTPE
ncbi:MFS transporter, partial [Georgenia sp. 10Sc9-8]|nr:MFS transporter [Georgenia halotolerans]